MSEQPVMTDMVEATFDITFKYPLGTIMMAQAAMEHFNRIGGTTITAKTVGSLRQKYVYLY